MGKNKLNSTKRRIRRLRLQAFYAQHGRCYWCGEMMCFPNPRDCQGKGERHPANSCTADHVVLRCNGGKDTPENIVAACKQCNSSRHEDEAPPPHVVQALSGALLLPP